MPEPKVADVLKALQTGSARELITLENVVVPSGASIGRITYETEEDGAILKAQFPSVFGAASPAAPATTQFPTFRIRPEHGVPASQRKAAFDAYLTKKNRSSRYRDECQRAVDIMVEIAGDLPPDDYTPTIIDHLMTRMEFLPLNPEKHKEHRERWAASTYAELSNEVELFDMPRIAAPTVSKHATRLSAFFAYCRRRQYMQGSNPMEDRAGAQGNTKGDSQSVKAKRKPFDTADLVAIFDPKRYRSRKLPHTFWPPLIALATGARVNEIAQLYLDDIVDDDPENPGRPRFMILPKRPDQRVKTGASIRSIPMHPMLIQMGFIRYIADVRRLGYQRVFPTLQHTSAAGYGDSVSEFFSAYLRVQVGIKDPQKVFHSFRHWFCNQLFQKSDKERMHIVGLTGHAREGEMEATYVRELWYPEKLKQLLKLELTDLKIEPYKSGGFDMYFKSYERNKVAAQRRKAAKLAAEAKEAAEKAAKALPSS